MTNQNHDNHNNNYNCNIVRDLLPLYLEELCSEDSRSYVEAHLAQCEACRDSCALMKRTDLTADAAEDREINAFKKLKTFFTVQMSISYLLFLAVLSIGVFTLLLTVSVNNFYWSSYALLMPLMMLATDFAFRSKTDPSVQKNGKTLLIPQGLLLLFSIFMMFYVMQALYRDLNSTPLGVPLHETGPILAAIFQTVIIVSLVILAVCLYQIIRKKLHYGMLPNISILCIFLNLTYLSMLYRMSSLEVLFLELLRNTLLLCGICALLSIIMRIARLTRRTEPSEDLFK
ncbi:MAG: zf-HC2 domain-containing protein [Acetatifactor sp.]|nr:zf-HC2 domain-containing protein [Acetatifactor sp.]